MKVKTAIGWIGGKSAFVEPILKIVDKTPHNAWVEAFCGSAVITLNKRPAKVELINDAHGILINFFKVVKNKPEELVKALDWELNSEFLFNQYRVMNLKELGNVQAAVAFLLLNKAAFGQRTSNSENGKGMGYWSPKSAHSPANNFNAYVLQKLVRRVHKRLSNVYVSCRDYKKLPRGFDSPDTLIYLDPPYLDSAESNKSYAGGISLKELWKFANSVKGRVIISHEANTKFEKAFKNWNVISIGYRLNHIGGGKVNTNPKYKKEELLFLNFEPPKERKGLFDE